MAISSVVLPRRTTAAARVGAYVALTKPRIIELLLITTLPTMIVAQRGLPPVLLMAATLLGGALAAGGANAINMFVDRDIDKLMHRTSKRPLVTGAVSPRNALVFAITLEVLAFVELWAWVNLLSAVLAMSATLFYVFVYTLWLKRTSSQNIVIGGAAGAVPVLVGWAAVTNSLVVDARRHVRHHLRLDAAPLLGPRRQIQGRLPGGPRAHAAGGRHLQADRPGDPRLQRHPGGGDPGAGRGGPPRCCVRRLGLGARCRVLAVAVRLLGRATPKAAMQLFSYSITYLTLLFVAMAVDIFTKH